MPRPTNEVLLEDATLTTQGLRRCRKCGEVKDLDTAFGLHKGKKRTYCKPCTNAISRASRLRQKDAAGPEEWTRRQRGWNQRHRSKLTEEQRRDLNRRQNLRQKYGLTPEQVDEMVAEQGGCALCGTAEPKGFNGKNWHVDHDHTTGRVRGVLCAGCNVGLGAFRENPDALRRAIDYLASHQLVEQGA